MRRSKFPNPGSNLLLKRANPVKIPPPRPSRVNPACLAQTYPRTYPVSQCTITLTEDYRIFYFNRTKSLKIIIHDFFGKRQVTLWLPHFFPLQTARICAKNRQNRGPRPPFIATKNRPLVQSAPVAGASLYFSRFAMKAASSSFGGTSGSRTEPTSMPRRPRAYFTAEGFGSG